MKTRLFVSLFIGALISVVLHAMPSIGDGTKPLFEPPIAGAAAAFVFWGMTGGSTTAGLLIATIVNAAMYGAVAYCVLSILWTAMGVTKR